MFIGPQNRNLIHDILSTIMGKVSAIVNLRPLVPVSTDPDLPFGLSPNVLLTQKFASDNEDSYLCDIGHKHMLKAKWKRSQELANQLWKRYQSEYLHSLQPSRNWDRASPNVKEGDIVLVKNESLRGQWSLAVTEKIFAGNNSLVRKVL